MTDSAKAAKISEVIARLRAWRRENALSQAAAVAVMQSLGFDIKQTTLEKWEIGALLPGRFTVQVLESFLDKHPRVTCPPGFRTVRDPLLASKAEQVRKLREKGETLRSIAERYGISESSVSRICAGTRRKAAAS